jgi:Uma2 family endonuclease
MAVRAPTPELWDDQEYYPLHEEDDVPEIPLHHELAADLFDALRARFPDCFITGNVCLYWERGNRSKYRAPDLFVVTEPLAEPVERVYLLWMQPPVAFVAEIGSKSTFRRDEGPKLQIYSRLVKAREYLYFDPPTRNLRLWRLGSRGFVAVKPEANGRLRSLELEVEFGVDAAGALRVYTLDGERLRTHQESERLLEATEQRLEEAEARAAAEAARRADLERQLAELHARPADRNAG